jgi:hypothetical protein
VLVAAERSDAALYLTSTRLTLNCHFWGKNLITLWRDKMNAKNLIANEKSEKFFLNIGEQLWYNCFNPRKQKAFPPYVETKKSLASNPKGYFLWKRGLDGKSFVE